MTLGLKSITRGPKVWLVDCGVSYASWGSLMGSLSVLWRVREETALLIYMGNLTSRDVTNIMYKVKS